jgi:hypothetical protein
MLFCLGAAMCNPMEERTLGYNLHHKKTSKIGKHEINYEADIYNLEHGQIGRGQYLRFRIGLVLENNMSLASRLFFRISSIDRVGGRKREENSKGKASSIQ